MSDFEGSNVACSYDALTSGDAVRRAGGCSPMLRGVTVPVEPSNLLPFLMKENIHQRHIQARLGGAGARSCQKLQWNRARYLPSHAV